MFVNEAMTFDVKTCHSDTNLEEIAKIMWDNDCGAVPVVNDANHPVGIITDRDIAMAAMINHQPLWNLQAARLIQGQHLCTCHQEDPIENCLTKMEQNGVRRILVVNEDSSLSGIITMGDILAFTSKAEARTKQASKGIGMDNVLEMLQNVSGHHIPPEQPVASM